MSYGTTRDWFGLASSGVRELQSEDDNPSYATDATGEDSNGDIACRTKAGLTNEYENTYRLIGGGDTTANDVALDNLAIVGDVVSYDTVTHLQITELGVETSNKEFPLLTVKGVKDPGAAATTHSEYSSGLSVKPIKKAQAIGVIADTATSTKIIGSNATISGSTATALDSLGEIAIREPYGVSLKGSNTLQACGTIPTAVADTANGYALDNPIGYSGSNTAYGTATADVYKDILGA